MEKIGSNKDYHPEPYWSEVGEKIRARGGQNIIAGDDEPYYRYKRKKTLHLLDGIQFDGKKVLELGSGPGGNLNWVWQQGPERLAGADISARMIELATINRLSEQIELHKIDGQSLPFEDGEFDIVFSVTVLQHNTDDEMMRNILSEMCRVSSEKVVLLEQVERKMKGTDLCMGRPPAYYASICNKHGFELDHVKNIHIEASWFMAGVSRKLLNPERRKEGESLSKLSLITQKILLPVTSFVDPFIPSRRNLAKMVFQKSEQVNR